MSNLNKTIEIGGSIQTNTTNLDKPRNVSVDNQLPTIITDIIKANARKFQDLIGMEPSKLPQVVNLIAGETIKAKEDQGAYISTYIKGKLINQEELTEEEFNFVFEKENQGFEIEEALKGKLKELIKNFYNKA